MTPSRRGLQAVLRTVLVVGLVLGTAECTLRVFALFTSVGLPPISEVVDHNETVELAVYGDSTPFGLGAETDFPREIARTLGTRVLNRSRPGLNSAQVVSVMQTDLDHYRPRILLFMAGVNDGWNLQAQPADLLGPAARWYQLLPQLRLARLAGIWWEAGIGASRLDTGELWRARRETSRLLSNRDLRRLLESSYDRADALATSSGARLLFVGYQSSGWNEAGALAAEVLRDRFADRSVPLRDLFDGRTDLLQEDRFHPTAQGQRLIADRIVGDLRRRGWTESP